MAFFDKRYHPPGTPPGTLKEKSAGSAAPLSIRVIHYTADEVSIAEHLDLAASSADLHREGFTWIHLQGQLSEAILQDLGTRFRLHPLALEDVLNSGQRPKVESYDDQLFVILNLPLMADGLVRVQQASFFLNKNFLISFNEGTTDPFRQIVLRMQEKGSRLRTHGIDFLLYSLIDVTVDQGFPVLEAFGQQLDELEEQILVSPNSNTLEKIHTLKRELILLRRMIWPQREVINQLLRGDSTLIQEGSIVYLRDCYDHTIQVMDLLETYRDMSSSMLDIYMSSISNHMNDIMRILTVIATIFIPLTFIVGVYGMNFDRGASHWNMPELGWPFGYLLVWGVMLVIAVVMLVFFRRRGWF